MNKSSKVTSYARAPERLQALQPSLANEPDVFGVEDRLRAIRATLEGRSAFGNAVDLGGHSGFFSLSLADLGLLKQSTVYDLDMTALAAGRQMAETLGLTDRVQYAQQAIDLEFIRQLSANDLIICLNLLHHAGARFDHEDVKARGWGEYAAECLRIFRQKSRVSIIGLGFKTSRPLYWDVAKNDRPTRFFELVERAGWKVLYDANVEDIQALGVAAADGRRTRHKPRLAGPRATLKRIATKVRGGRKGPSKAHNYHIFILE